MRGAFKSSWERITKGFYSDSVDKALIKTRFDLQGMQFSGFTRQKRANRKLGVAEVGSGIVIVC
jgi:hypothetical protein